MAAAMIRFRLGTRGSPLALTQAAMVRDALCAAHGWRDDEIETVVIRTTGDRVQDRALAEIGGKALWTKELDRALLAGEIDACGAFDEGRRDDPPRRDRDRRDAAARRRARPADRRRPSIADLPLGRGRRHQLAAPPRAAAAAAPRPRRRAVSRQCRHAAGEAGGGRGGRDAARGGGARPAGARCRPCDLDRRDAARTRAGRGRDRGARAGRNRRRSSSPRSIIPRPAPASWPNARCWRPWARIAIRRSRRWPACRAKC